ncbi:MAG: 4Fe-4S dicluster domain-containing protein [Candidatus Omnitrophota bacterium]
MKRKIIEIDREKCNGCGLCTKACAEGALVLDKDNKAVLVKEIFCDGMGACLDVCPVDALKIIERESDGYDPKAAFDHVLKTQGTDAAKKVHGAPVPPSGGTLPHFGGCPGTMAREIKREVSGTSGSPAAGSVASELSQWPIQLHLISPLAPYFKECDLLIAADCTAFTLGSFHQDMLKGKKLVIACPKLDETEGYVEKIAELLKHNTVYSLTVVIMEVPCCTGLFRMVQEAVALSGKQLPVKRVVVGLDGAILV